MVTALVVTVPGAEVELASDALWSLGVVAIEERLAEGDVDDGTVDHLVELWTSLGDDPDVVTHAAAGFPARWRWHLVDVDDDTANTWRSHSVASWVAPDLVVCPAWVPFSAPHDAPRDLIVIDIEPGSTFGLGDHPTTMLTLRALRSVVARGADVLDVGAGSGVLSVGAALFGAGSVTAIDISPASPATVIANAEANGVGGVIEASTTTLADVDAIFDVVCANILAPTLVDLADDLRRVLVDDGVLLISGILADHHQHVLDALAPLVAIQTDVLEGWACVTLRR
jgi:ribosomal protein L11 methyltransferase